MADNAKTADGRHAEFVRRGQALTLYPVHQLCTEARKQATFWRLVARLNK